MNTQTLTYNFCKPTDTHQDFVTRYGSDNDPGSSYENHIIIEATSSTGMRRNDEIYQTAENRV